MADLPRLISEVLSAESPDRGTAALFRGSFAILRWSVLLWRGQFPEISVPLVSEVSRLCSRPSI